MSRKGLALILALALGLALGVTGCGGRKGEIKTEAVAVKLARETVKGGYQLVTTATLKKWMDAGRKMIIVDTMPFAASYKKRHVPGAVQFEFPIPEMKALSPQKAAAYQKLLGANKGALIVVYCGFVKCGRSHNGAIWARKLGYTNVYRYPGGIVAWTEAGYPVQSAK
jgi:thiosulfate/3-mercaptopyruvate sulfurtransferase